MKFFKILLYFGIMLICSQLAMAASVKDVWLIILLIIFGAVVTTILDYLDQNDTKVKSKK